MKIELGKDEPRESEAFRFKIGDTVITNTSRNVGLVVGGTCFNGTKPNRIFYQIQLSNGKLWTVMEETIGPYSGYFKRA